MAARKGGGSAASVPQRNDEASAAVEAAGAVLAIGGADFASALMTSLRRSAGVDHCMVFCFDGERDARCLLDAGDIAIGGELGAAYAGHFHRSDPNRDRIFEQRQARRPIMLPAFARRMYSDSYRRLFFENSGIVDKFATAIWFDDRCFYVNFYRLAAAGVFSAADAARLQQAAPAVTAAVARHFARAEPDQPQRPPDVAALLAGHPRFAGLTGREREVCLRILSGQSSEAISNELSISIHSTLTYRRRAYERLGISSQNELFGLVLKHLTAAASPPSPGLN